MSFFTSIGEIFLPNSNSDNGANL